MPMFRIGASALFLVAFLGLSEGRAAEAIPGLDEIPLAQSIEVMVADRQLLAFDARGGGQIREDLRLEERVLWKGAQGRVGVVVTDQRLMAVGVGSGAWQVAELQLGETVAGEAMLGDRVALIQTNRRALGFGGEPLAISERPLGLRENVLARRVGESVAVLVTDRRALGLSPFLAGFAEIKLWLDERIESVSAVANLATLRSDRRILIFRSSSRSWEERRLNLP